MQCVFCDVGTEFLDITYINLWERGNEVRWGTALQAGRSRFRFPLVSLEFFIDI